MKELVVVEYAECKSNGTSSYSLYALLLRKRGSDVFIDEEFNSNSVDEFHQWMVRLKDKPVIFTISSDKILNKVYSKEMLTSHKDITQEIIPGAVINDFVSQQYSINDDQQFLSLIRVSHLSSIFNFTGLFKYNVVNVTIGPLSLIFAALINHRSSGEEAYELNVCNSNFIISDNYLERYDISKYGEGSRQKEKKVIVAGEKISEVSAPAFALGIYYLLNLQSASGVVTSDLKEKSTKYFFKRISNFVFICSGAALLLLLALSSIIFTIYRSKYSELLVSQENLQAQSNYALKSREKEEQHQRFLAESGYAYPSHMFFYADQVTRTISENIYLHNVTVSPVSKRSQIGTQVFDDKRIIIEGYCYSNEDINIWAERLKELPWVKDVMISDFKQAPGEDLNSFHVELIKRKSNDL